MTTLPAPLRWYWRVFIPLMALTLFGFVAVAAGPGIELRLDPIRGPQHIALIERSATRVCWAWTFTKLRDISSDNLDAFFQVNGDDGGVTAPYDMDSGRPWGLAKYAVPPRADPYTLRECASLPPYVMPTDTVVVRQVAFYPGRFGLWKLAVPFPDVVSPGAPPA